MNVEFKYQKGTQYLCIQIYLSYVMYAHLSIVDN